MQAPSLTKLPPLALAFSSSARTPATAQPMKIGVLTFHRCINYGSYWQARLLVEALQNMGHRAVLLDHHSRRVNMAEWRCALRPVLPTPVAPADRKLYAHKTRKFLESMASLPLSRRFALETSGAMDDYDAVVVGSDEVWNLWHPWYGRCPIFFGEGVRAKRLIAYAASFGNYPAGQGLPQHWAGMLHQFHSMSVRDANSRALLGAALGHAPELVLDPCLQFAPPPEPREPQHKKPHRARHVAVYGHNFSDWFAVRMREWARKRNMRLVSIGYRNDWADTQWLTASPEDFARFMADADAVATNFFHGCVFALRNRKPFACENSAHRAIKIHDLLFALGAQHHLADADTPAAHCDAVLSEPLAPAIEARIAALRASSGEYLQQALQQDTMARTEERAHA
ncbi:polysaccharide pyruvyl transferase family protein [Variovorax paradoxus]|uniref:polysaccharide pyruvyl transferase family protein n=1 Tax=Variovorax paradoxus TaxID=34073 RepID=UPI003D659B50